MKSDIERILQETRPESDFSSSENFVADGLLDSFDIIVVVSEIEELHNISIDGNLIIPENFVSVGAILNLIESCR
jgi:acyl carrier protein